MANPNLVTELQDWNGCECVESVPERMHGTPVLVNSRMPADGVIENFDEGMTVAELVDEYGLEESSVVGALRFSQRLKQANAA